MMQKEVARRLAARPGDDDYSSVSCFVQYYAKVRNIHTVRSSCFFPAPDVDSSLVRLDFLKEPPVAVKDEGLFFRIIRGAFNQKRKSIINSLSRKPILNMSKSDLEALLKKVGIDPSVRPEALSLSDFATISNLL